MEEIQELKPDPFFREVRFLSSYADASKVPSKGIPHFAFAGRSNSGKSRLLNAIVERKSLAKVSAAPGKTKLLNFFFVSKSLFLVDTPGFGYSSNSHKDHEQMMTLLMNYLNSAKDLKCLFLLSDAQRELPEEELELIGTCFEKGTKPVLIRTKIDKLNQSELSKLRKKMKSIQGLYPMLEIVLVSPKYGKGLPELRKIIETMMKTIIVPTVEEDSIPEEVHEQA